MQQLAFYADMQVTEVLIISSFYIFFFPTVCQSVIHSNFIIFFSFHILYHVFFSLLADVFLYFVIFFSNLCTYYKDVTFLLFFSLVLCYEVGVFLNVVFCLIFSLFCWVYIANIAVSLDDCLSVCLPVCLVSL